MHKLAAHTVRQALRDGAKIDPLDDFDALAELDAAARASESLPLWREAEILDAPVLLGDPAARSGRCAVLYPPSYAALVWIEDNVDAFFGAATLKGNLACAWALAHAYDPESFAMASTPRLAGREVKRWAAGLNCGIEALLTATRRLLMHDERYDTTNKHGSTRIGPEGGRKKKLQARLMLARLTHEFGQAEDYFLYGPRDRLMAAIDLIQKKDEAERKAIAKAEGKAAARDPDAPEQRAFVRWREASEAFLERYKG